MSIFAWKVLALIMVFIMIIMLTFLFAEILSDEIEDEKRRQQKSFFINKVEDTKHPLLNKIAKYYLKH